MPPNPTSHSASIWRARLAVASSPAVVRKALIAAVVVGSLLVLLNQGDLIFSGQMTGRVLLKSLITPVIPFFVTLLGAVLNAGASGPAAALRPGRAAVRRSLIIAVVVGGIIIAVNQGDLLLSGQITPAVLIKSLITPCVPFCVSLYGAYVAYRTALERERASG